MHLKYNSHLEFNMQVPRMGRNWSQDDILLW